ncbi:DUF4468 domain-containing protein [Flavobacterium sp.]|uniref:DUF4468 domain-containing protein n=1 Tax=Flavobacterium sp. TaxID=239 RepID=UPI0026392C2F|nr:DUF4468 domain-containing protein [Flavobacterium sp.]MDD2986180.1 DUF4468 domain-containing protein [Flavobacterium sp.]
MKHLFTLLLFTVFFNSFSQSTKFEFTKDGFTDFLVTEIPDLKATEIYTKTLNWIKENYNNPDEVIKMTIVNEKIRINGYSKSYTCANSMGVKVCSDANYIIEISFKDNKYKIDPIELSSLNPDNPTVKSNFDFNNTEIYFDKKGELKKFTKDFPKDVEFLFNGINESLKNYILGLNKDVENDW